jgi:glycosyltransferase involved in cell wall biosynthesis
MSLVTVVIPAYNAAEWIAKSLESVLQQTYRDVEIILIDDGSTDNTVEIAERILRKGRYQYQILHQENMGPSAARNRGWRTARGTWIQFLDADDLLHPRKIELQIIEQSRGTPDVIYSDWQRLVCAGCAWQKENYIYTPIIGKSAVADLLRDANFIHLGSALLNSSVLTRIGGFDESHWLIEDVELHLKIAMAKGKFAKAASNGPLFWHRDRPQSLSKSNQRQFVEGCIRNARLVARHFDQSQNWSPEILEAVVDVYHQGARYFAEHDWKEFQQIATEIETLRPRFVPKAPSRLRRLSRFLGYRNAERVAFLYRKMKRERGG